MYQNSYDIKERKFREKMRRVLQTKGKPPGFGGDEFISKLFVFNYFSVGDQIARMRVRTSTAVRSQNRFQLEPANTGISKCAHRRGFLLCYLLCCCCWLVLRMCSRAPQASIFR